MAKQSAQLDRIFYALADPTRRAVLRRLGRSPAAVSELAQPFRMALPSFTQHLNVLEECGLVRSKKTGRVRTYQAAPRPLKMVEQWLAEHREVWENRLSQLDSFLETMKEK
ncbi:MAG: ArsR/SmtB family transcription factor [Arenimonas sp.]